MAWMWKIKQQGCGQLRHALALMLAACALALAVCALSPLSPACRVRAAAEEETYYVHVDYINDDPANKINTFRYKYSIEHYRPFYAVRTNDMEAGDPCYMYTIYTVDNQNRKMNLFSAGAFVSGEYKKTMTPSILSFK